MGRKRSSTAVNALSGWLKRRSAKEKTLLGVVVGACALLAVKFFNLDHYDTYIASEAVHALGIFVLIYKLTTHKTCSGLSLKTQELTALLFALRLVSNSIDEFGVHTFFDFATFISTAWVIYTIRFKLKSTYSEELDNMPLYYLLVPCAILSLFVKPYAIWRSFITRVVLAFSVYLESIAVLPQLRLMQNIKMIEPFTAHYVFALGVARFLSFAYWVIAIYETGGKYIFSLGSGDFWVPTYLLAELLQTFILADFCYYYVKSVMQGRLIVRMPV